MNWHPPRRNEPRPGAIMRMRKLSLLHGTHCTGVWLRSKMFFVSKGILSSWPDGYLGMFSFSRIYTCRTHLG